MIELILKAINSLLNESLVKIKKHNKKTTNKKYRNSNNITNITINIYYNSKQ